MNRFGVPTPATGHAAAIAAFGLPGSRRVLPPQPLTPANWRGLLSFVRAQRLTGLLASAVEHGALPVSEAQADELRHTATGSAHVALLLERLLLDSAQRLAAAEIPFRVLKGAAVAHTAYPDPSMRSFGDIDLLVPGERFCDAVELFTAEGAYRQFPEPRPGFYRRFGKGATMTMPSGLEVDLHRLFVPGPFGLGVELASLFSTATRFWLGNVTLEGLGADEQLLHACFHAVLGNATPRLTSVRDVAQILLTGDVDHERVLHLAGSWKAEAVVAAAIEIAWETLDLADKVPLSAWATRYEPTGRDVRLLRLYAGRTRNPVAQSVAAVRAVRGARAKAAYLHALLLPSNTPADAGTAYHRWRRGIRALSTEGM